LAPPPETSCPILERHCLKCARNLHPATGEEPRVRFDIPFGGNRTFSVRLKIALSGSLGQAVTIAVARRDRSVPEVMAFQTKSLGDGVYRLSPFTSGAYEIFAQVRGAAPLKALVNRVTRQIEFLRQGKQEAFTSDLVIGVRKGTGKVASPTVGGPHPTHDLGRSKQQTTRYGSECRKADRRVGPSGGMQVQREQTEELQPGRRKEGPRMHLKCLSAEINTAQTAPLYGSAEK